ncbi:MAG: hypothetical protein CVV41_13900 [Candidatus Riflebacteria bacterium HGW-Riflebacteria-1]|jgi:hypothetical protein|nr:MAG: hypothetical protein CVV41_13900 [Candidatus Riflebacteria bacterium HGW-Riflebacteria-1]
MKRTPAYLLAIAIVVLTPMITCANEVILANLSDKFGQISHRNLESSHEFVFSGEFTDIEHALNLVNSNDLFVQSVSVSARDDGKAAIVIKASSARNQASKRFATFSNIIKPGMISWKKGEVPENMAVVTTIETDFANSITLHGLTLKSSLIFSHLFPMIERSGELRDPFFSRGTYSDTGSGRVMDFTVLCQW